MIVEDDWPLSRAESSYQILCEVKQIFKWDTWHGKRSLSGSRKRAVGWHWRIHGGQIHAWCGHPSVRLMKNWKGQKLGLYKQIIIFENYGWGLKLRWKNRFILREHLRRKVSVMIVPCILLMIRNSQDVAFVWLSQGKLDTVKDFWGKK